MACHSNEMECPVQLAITTSAESVPLLVLARGDLDRRGAGEAGEGGFVAATTWVGPGEVERSGSDVPDPAFGYELRSGRIDQRPEGGVVLGDFSIEVPASAGDCSHSVTGATFVDRSGRAVPELCATTDDLMSSEITQP